LRLGNECWFKARPGGVGAFAVQLAHRAGAHVIATASTHNLDFARELGADEAVDYATTRVEVVVRDDMDVVLDTVGGETQARSWGVLKPGGILVSVVAAPSQEQAAAHGVRGAFFVVEPDRGQLVELGQLIDTEQLRPVVEAVIPARAGARVVCARREGVCAARSPYTRSRHIVVEPRWSESYACMLGICPNYDSMTRHGIRRTALARPLRCRT
jgi:Zinc-binding dehydrogenase